MVWRLQEGGVTTLIPELLFPILLLDKNVKVISYWPSYKCTGPRSAVLSLRPRANIAYLEPVTGPKQNHLITNIIVFLFITVNLYTLYVGPQDILSELYMKQI